MKRRYLITLVGSEEPNGSRIITTEAENGQEVLFAVEYKYLRDYVPNKGDTLLRDDDDGSITFEKRRESAETLIK